MYNKTDGGPIGLRLTNAIARVRMIHWPKRVMQILAKNNIKVWLCKSYVDDVRWLLTKKMRGCRYVPEVSELVYDPAYDKMHEHMGDYEYTGMVLKDVMNNVVGDMKFTVEDQTEYPDRRLPTLDFTLKYCSKGNQKILYQFYKKPMASKLAILQPSALAENTKQNTITQEIIGRMSNTCQNTTQYVRNTIIEKYIVELSNSGYSKSEIRKFVIPGLIGYERRVIREGKGGIPIHRPGAVIKKLTAVRKMLNTTDW